MTRPPQAGAAEVEIKFRVASDGRAEVLGSSWLGGATEEGAETLRSVYYDTPAGDLRAAGVTLRLRHRGAGPSLLCAKFPHVGRPVFERREAEVAVTAPEPQLAAFDAETAAELAQLTGGRALAPVFETQVQRRCGTLQRGCSRIELALDEGRIVAGAAELPLLELELELKSGSLADLLDLAEEMLARLPLRLDFESKGERGYRLAAGAAPAARSAERLSLARGTGIDAAFAAILAAALQHFTGNWAALREGDEPAAVHQSRVALRRLRTALALFQKLSPDADFSPLRARAKALADGLAQARAADVLLERLQCEGPAGDRRPAGHDGLLAALRIHRAATRSQARAVIEGAEASAVVLAVQRLAAERSSRAGPDDPVLQPAARAMLARLARQARKRGRHVARLNDAERHRLRITLKKLRYAGDFFGGLFGHARRQKNFAVRLSQLQDLLGAHNDAVTAREVLGRLPLKTNVALAIAAGHVMGWQDRGIPLADAELERRWRQFKQACVFWA